MKTIGHPLNLLALGLLLALSGGCQDRSPITSADWRAADKACAEHGGVLNLLRADVDDPVLTAVCDDSSQQVVEMAPTQEPER